LGYDTTPKEVYDQEIKARAEVKAEREALVKEINEELLKVKSTWEMSEIGSIGAWFEKDTTRKFLSFVAIAAAIGILCTRGGTKKHRTKKHCTKKHCTKKHRTKKHCTKKHRTKKHRTKKHR
jgi:hypothetical protein